MSFYFCIIIELWIPSFTRLTHARKYRYFPSLCRLPINFNGSQLIFLRHEFITSRIYLSLAHTRESFPAYFFVFTSACCVVFLVDCWFARNAESQPQISSSWIAVEYYNWLKSTWESRRVDNQAVETVPGERTRRRRKVFFDQQITVHSWDVAVSLLASTFSLLDDRRVHGTAI